MTGQANALGLGREGEPITNVLPCTAGSRRLYGPREHRRRPSNLGWYARSTGFGFGGSGEWAVMRAWFTGGRRVPGHALFGGGIVSGFAVGECPAGSPRRGSIPRRSSSLLRVCVREAAEALAALAARLARQVARSPAHFGVSQSQGGATAAACSGEALGPCWEAALEGGRCFCRRRGVRGAGCVKVRQVGAAVRLRLLTALRPDGA